MPDGDQRAALRVVLPYTLVAVIWLLFSDAALLRLTADAALVSRLQSAKGLLFVAVTAGLLFALLLRELRRRRAIEDALRASEARFRAFFEHAPVYCYMVAPNGLILDVNAAACAALGYSRTELVGAPVSHLYAPAARAKAQAVFERWRATGRVLNEELSLQTRLGAERVVLLSAEAVRDAAGQVLYAVFVQRDITDRAQTEAALRYANAALRASEERLARVVETAPDGLIIVDAAGQITFANAAAERILGLTRRALTERQYDDPAWRITAVDGGPFPPEALPFAQVMATGRVITGVEHAIEHPDGRRVILTINAAPLRESGDAISGVVAVINDITERRQVETALRESEAKFRHVFEAANVGKSITLPTGEIFVNQAFADMLGYSRDELASKTWQAVTPPDEIDSIQAILAPLLNGEKDAARFSKRYVRKDGSFLWADVSVAIQRGPDGRPLHFITTIVDITEQRRAQEALRESEQRYAWIFEKAPFAASLSRLPDGAIEQVNEEFERLFGYSRQEVLGRTSLALGMHPDPEARLRAAAQVREQGYGRRVEMALRTKSGAVRDFLVNTDFVEIGAKSFVLLTAQDVTERKRMEAELRRSEERFSKVFAASPAGITITRIADGMFVDANEAFCGMFEFSRAEVIGRTSTELKMWTPEARARLIQAQLASGGLRDFELQARSKTGRLITVLFSSVPIQLEGETHHVTTMIDITERKQAEETVRYQANLLENISDAVISTGPDFVIRSWNRGAELVYGWPAADVIGRPAGEVIPSAYPNDDAARVFAHFQEQGFWKGEVVQRRKDGAPLAILSSVTLIHDAAGRPNGVVAVNRDITDLKQAQAALRESEERYRNLLEVAPVGIAVHSEGKLVFTNPAGARLLGAASPEQLIGKPVLEIIHPDGLEAAPARIQRMLAGEQEPYPVEDVFVRLDGTPVEVEVMATPLKYEGKPAVQMIVSDITERKKAQDALRQLNAELEQRVAERTAALKAQYQRQATLEERQRLARDLHDVVSQTLFSASVIAETLPRLWERSPDQVRRGLDELHRLTRGALAEMRALLLELRPEALAQTNLADLLRQLASALAGRTDLELTLAIEPAPALPGEVRLGLYRIAQEALNNVVNHARARRVEIALAALGDGVSLAIRDDGQGFDPDTVRPGRLGLGILGERAAAIGATLAISSAPGAGTEISVAWPGES